MTHEERQMVKEGINALRAFYTDVLRSDKLHRMVTKGELNLGRLMDWQDSALDALDADQAEKEGV